jgi:nitrate/nitrite-specific signal transduction histidine kinase
MDHNEIVVLYGIAGAMGGIIVALVMILVRTMAKVAELSETLDTVRMATYELTTMAQDDICDLQDSLKDAAIPLSRKHLNERMRRKALTPEESMAEFEATVTKFQAVTAMIDNEEKP